MKEQDPSEREPKNKQEQEDKQEQDNREQTNKQDRGMERDHGRESEEEWTEADFMEEEDEDEEPLEPSVHRVWVKRAIVAIVALALVGNLFAVIPLIFNLNVIQYLKKTRELSQIAELQAYKQAIVIVKSEDRKGTGFNIAPDGVIITNAHVVDTATSAVIGFEDDRVYRAKVVALDDELDLAVLRVEEPPGEPLPLLELDPNPVYTKGLQIYYIGNPYFFNHIIGEGSVHGITAPGDRASPVLAINAPIYKGNSGSPVINEAGKVIAVVYATSRIREGNDWRKVGLAVPIQELDNIWSTDHLPSY